MLQTDIDIFKESAKPKESVKKEKKALTLKTQLYFLMEKKKFLMLLKVECLQKENKEKVLQVF